MRQSKNLDLFLKPGLKICYVCQFTLIIFLLVCLTVIFPGCAPVFSELQSAKLVGPGHLEVTPSFSSVSFSSEDESGHVQNHYGIQAGLGVSSMMDFRLRYERVSVDIQDMDGGESLGVNVLGFGPKFSVVKDMVAAYVPIGFAFGEDIEVSETWQIHPTLLITLPISKYIEFNPSAKVLIPLKGEQDTLVAFNLGTAISTNLEKWAIRPEVGFLYNPGENGHFIHFSIGFTYFIK
ncbi:MAG: hypothetical protein GTN73_02680 [Candidatus Aminicenantes bacterium]|nr:hypothetical protein [Candidatus Aminicenantes bacterium]